MFAHVFGTHILRQFWSLVTILLALGVSSLSGAQPISECTGPFKEVELSRAQAVRVLAKTESYTQGLLYSNRKLYESTGLVGQSSLRTIDTQTSMVQTIRTLNPSDFAAGITMLGEDIFQLVKNANIVYRYTGNQTEPLPLTLNRPAWGLTTLNNQFVFSDGSTKLKFMSPLTMKVVKEVEIHRGALHFPKLNELEAVKGNILANVDDTDLIAVIRPRDGCVMGLIDVTKLRTPQTRENKDAKCAGARCTPEDFATNGIAYDAVNDDLYITGRNWPYIFVFKFPADL